MSSDEVKADVTFPITIEKDGATTVLRDFSGFTVPARLGLIYQGIWDLFKDKYYSNGVICLSCLMDFIENNSLNIDIYSESGDDIFVIKDNQSKIGDKEFKFIFANKR
jgi:hypothetical protein